MRDSLTSENSRDFRQRYNGTFALFTKGDGRKITVRIDNVTENAVQFSDIKKNTYTANSDTGVEFEFFPLNRRLTDYKNNVIYSSRQPARQWRRGICEDNTNIINLDKLRKVSFDGELIDRLFNSEIDYENIHTRFLKEDRMSFLLSNKFAIIRRSDMSEFYLYNHMIGELRGTTIKCNPIFIQEVKDALVARNFNQYKVEANE